MDASDTLRGDGRFSGQCEPGFEVDGEYHRERVTADARRDRVLGRLGYRVLRLEAELVMHAPAEAVARIRAALASTA